MQLFPEWMKPGVVFKWTHPTANNCHYRVIAVSPDRSKINVVVVKASTMGHRPLGLEKVLTNHTLYYNPVIITPTNYNRSTYELRRTKA